MIVACYLVLSAAGMAILLDLWAWYLLRTHRDVPAQRFDEWPQVAVLVPARNEEEYLPYCLQSLLQLEYPPQKLHILIGDDASTDRTLAIAEEWSRQYPHIRVIKIEKEIGLARGKANVLAQLVHHCPEQTEFFFMTDADIRPHPFWIRRLLQAMEPGVGLVCGTTVVSGRSLWARWQQTDWAIALGLAKGFTYLPGIGRTLTAIGNNMLISRQAYAATGGYERIPFSITEDYELMVQVCRRGYKAVHILDPESSALTAPVQRIGRLLHQRKRWMTGAMRLPLPMILLLFVQALFFPALLVMFWQYPVVGILALFLKIGAQILLARQVLYRMGVVQMPAAGFFYELYLFIINILLVIFYLLPLKITWKDRTYQKNQP
jgi:cellulose synthase/poly-beta-1,6-N-acetylglucosamine synthase-like glycosyltransferase